MCEQAERLSPNAVGEKVREFYDHHPYPPPVESLDQYQQRWHDPQRRRADFHLFWPGRNYREDQSILIAGCGTSQAAKHALRWPAADVVGIDCSAASVRHTERLKHQHNLKNLHVHQLSIGHVRELGLTFDQIVCTGVLHHLAEPERDLSALYNVLRSDGAMQLMVYAPYGRTGIYMMQEFCRRLRIRTDNTGIRDLICTLSALPSGHPLQSTLTQSPELRNEAAIADALLHPQDRAYSVSQFLELIDKAGLVFGRWLRQAPYSVHCGIMAQIPPAAAIACLAMEQQYAAIELLRGTMSRHSAVLYRDHSIAELHSVNFTTDDWRAYVPVRMPDTVFIQDPLPPDIVGVLINRTHTYKDLFLKIDFNEKKLFDAIDGQHTIAAIAKKTLSQISEVAGANVGRNFFEKLWWHDQVVLDMKAKYKHR